MVIQRHLQDPSAQFRMFFAQSPFHQKVSKAFGDANDPYFVDDNFKRNCMIAVSRATFFGDASFSSRKVSVGA